MNDAIESIAATLRRAYQTGEPVPPFRDSLLPGDLDAAYAIQAENTAHWERAGHRRVGRKIGLTSRQVQSQLGVDQPDYGVLFANMETGQNNPIDTGRLLQPRIEAEVALILGHDLPHADCSGGELIRATECVAPALEIVDSRVRGWEIGIVETIADNASSGLFVLGGPVRRLEGLDLHSCRMTLTCADEEVSHGDGAACLGHPLNAALWLAREVARRGSPLRAGEVVLTGALGPMVPVRADEHYRAEIEGLGSVSVAFS